MDKMKRRIFTDINGVKIPQDINLRDVMLKVDELVEGHNEIVKDIERIKDILRMDIDEEKGFRAGGESKGFKAGGV